jgi:hypothetical protein
MNTFRSVWVRDALTRIAGEDGFVTLTDSESFLLRC